MTFLLGFLCGLVAGIVFVFLCGSVVLEDDEEG